MMAQEPEPEADLLLDNLCSLLDKELNSADTPAQVSHPPTGVHFEEQLAAYEEKKTTVYARPLHLPRNPRPDKRPNVFKWSLSPTPRTPLHPIPTESGTPEEEEVEEVKMDEDDTEM